MNATGAGSTCSPLTTCVEAATSELLVAAVAGDCTPRSARNGLLEASSAAGAGAGADKGAAAAGKAAFDTAGTGSGSGATATAAGTIVAAAEAGTSGPVVAGMKELATADTANGFHSVLGPTGSFPVIHATIIPKYAVCASI